jgi:hypothetical protein
VDVERYGQAHLAGVVSGAYVVGVGQYKVGSLDDIQAALAKERDRRDRRDVRAALAAASQRQAAGLVARLPTELAARLQRVEGGVLGGSAAAGEEEEEEGGGEDADVGVDVDEEGEPKAGGNPGIGNNEDEDGDESSRLRCACHLSPDAEGDAGPPKRFVLVVLQSPGPPAMAPAALSLVAPRPGSQVASPGLRSYYMVV